MTHSSLKDILTALPEKERGHFDSESTGTDVLVFAALYLKNAAPVKILLKSGLSVSEPCSDGYNALDAAFANEFGSKEILKAVFAAASEPSPEQKLRYAVCVKPLKEVEALLKGQDVNARHGYFQSPLLSDAVRFKRSAAFVRALVKAGANVNACDESGQTPLFEAGGNFKLMKELAENGADVNAVDNDGDAFADNLFYTRHPVRFVRFMLKHGATEQTRERLWQNLTDRILSPRAAPLTAWKELLKTGISADTPDARGHTALMQAAKYARNIRLIRLLIKAGANVNAVDERTGASVLCQMAAERGEDFDAVVKMLIKAGADPCLKDKNGADFYAYAFGTK